METLAYIHLALADEVPSGVGVCEGVDWRKFSSRALSYLLPLIAVTFGILGMVNEVLAQQARLGDRNSNVTLIQERLRELRYFNQQPTGVFGEITENAVRQFQISNLLEADGIVGRETEAELFYRRAQLPPVGVPRRRIPREQFVDPPNNRTILRRGDRNDNVKQLQLQLLRNSFNPGPIDGIYGSQTERAVIAFQLSRNLRPTGVADVQTLQALGITKPDKKRYVVIVPGDYNTFVEVRQYVSGASWRDDRRGTYVNAGSFNNRNEAESWSYKLRARGFDARVEYF